MFSFSKQHNKMEHNMAQVIVAVDSIEEVQAGIALLSIIAAGFGGEVAITEDVQEEVTIEGLEEVEVEEVVLEETTQEDDDLSSLMEDELEPEGVTIDDIKAAFKNLAGKKKKEGAMEVINNIFKKLKVKKMDEIPEEKRELVVNILNKAADK